LGTDKIHDIRQSRLVPLTAHMPNPMSAVSARYFLVHHQSLLRAVYCHLLNKLLYSLTVFS